MAFAEGYHRALRDSPPLTEAQDQDARSAVKEALTDPQIRCLYLERRSHANSQTQRQRLMELTEQALDLLDWDLSPVDACRDGRHQDWMTHWGSRTERVSDDPSDLARFAVNST